MDLRALGLAVTRPVDYRCLIYLADRAFTNVECPLLNPSWCCRSQVLRAISYIRKASLVMNKSLDKLLLLAFACDRKKSVGSSTSKHVPVLVVRLHQFYWARWIACTTRVCSRTRCAGKAKNLLLFAQGEYSPKHSTVYTITKT